VGNPEEKEPPGKSERMWQDYNKIYLRVLGWGGMDWTDLAQDGSKWRSLVSTIMNPRIPYNFRKLFRNFSRWS
jgi:hypothetical protein